jgi:hypothetical protein
LKAPNFYDKIYLVISTFWKIILMKNLFVFGLISTLLFPFSASAQTVVTPINPGTIQPNIYPTGYQPPINNINNGIQGSVGYGGASQCGTLISIGGTSSPGTAVGLSNPENSYNHPSNSYGAQILVTHNLNNPCINQKDQICTTGKIQLIQNNPTMPLERIKELLNLFDSFCGK